jgi:outer membrane protein W
MKNPTLQICLFFLLLLSPAVNSQSIGISIGSGYYYIINNVVKYENDPIKTVSLRYVTNLDNNFRMNITAGYGFSNYRYNDAESGPTYNNNYEYHSLTDGFLTEIECQYQHYLTSDSIFEPTLGIGIGYCDFRTNLKVSSNIPDDKMTTKGFSQFISLGMNIHISKRFTGYIELKKLIFTNIKINTLPYSATPYKSTNVQDYSPLSGLLDLGITLGVNYNF